MKTRSVFLIAAGLISSSPAAAETIMVEPGGSIQAAVNRASSGDVVVVQPGTYQPFQINRNNITVKSSTPGGAHVVAGGNDQPAISAYGQSGIGVFDFRITSQRGDGIKIGGSPGNMVSNVRVEGNVVESAARDGVKMFQTRNASVIANRIMASGTAGAAGQSGNRNGDGGIDWVQVEDSEMSDNEISSRGWACAMVKGGSRNNRVTNNDMVNCEVNGIDMAAGTTGDAGAANKSGLIAADNTVTGNNIRSGSCAVKLGDKTRNINVDGNSASGRLCDRGSGNGRDAAGASAIERGIGRVGDNVGDTEEQILRAIERGESGALLRMERFLSGRTLTDAANRAINKGTRTITGAIGNTIDDATDMVFQPVEDAVSDFGNAVICGIGGGWVSLLFGINVCASKQLGIQGRQLANQRRMTAALVTNSAADVGEIEWEARSPLGSMDGDLYGDNSADVLNERYHQGLPVEWTFETAAEHTRTIRSQTNLATQEAATVAAMSARAVGNALTVSDNALELSQSAAGQTSAIQAQTQMLRAQIAVDAAKHASDTASSSAALRMEEERRAAEVIAEQKLERFYGPGTLDANAPPRRSVFN
jgi:hypothetical protein